MTIPTLPTPFAWQARLSALAAQLVSWVILLAVLALVGWWQWERFVAHIQAPVKVERDTAIAANATLDKRLAAVEQRQGEIDVALDEQRARLNLTTNRLNTLEQARREVKATSPKAKAFLEQPIPPELLK